MNSAEIIGWASSVILILTIGRQVFTQWKTESTAGVSHWLFLGQCASSIGFTIYSVMLHNWVYVCSNVALLITGIVGQVLYLQNAKRAANKRPRQ
jgi:uncharacterized protein with PQ loop repeat